MKKLSLDEEPPPRFRGEKEVSKKKNKTLPQIILSARNEKNRDKSNFSAKTLEKKTNGDIREYSLEQGYLNTNEKQSEIISNKTNYIKFTSITTFSESEIEKDFKYNFVKNTASSQKARDGKFYEIDSSYSFTQIHQKSLKEYDKKEKYRSESKEKEESEVISPIQLIEKEENVILFTTRNSYLN